MPRTTHDMWSAENGQGVVEYGVMLMLILMLVVGVARLMGANANNVFSSVASKFQQQGDD